MQGKLIIGGLLLGCLATPSFAAVDQPQRPGCQRGEAQQQVQRVQQRQWAQQQSQQRAKPQGCTITRTIPSVVDPTPTFLL